MTEASAGTTDFAALADAAWPALERAEAGGWQMRFAAGVTKRANSAWWVGNEADTSPDALAAVEIAYRERGLPPLFQLSAAQGGARARLIGRGYRALDETLVLAASLAARETVPDDGVELADEPGDEWLAVWWSVDGRGGEAELETARRILTGVPAVYAALRIDGALVAVARLAPVGEWGGLYCVATLPEHRRRGYSERVVAAALAAGAEHGVTDAWLQVLARNQAAAALYARFGFAEVDRYEYLVGALRLPPAAACRA
ncbi:GNAT family N-acetyltransferase [Gryllotalpicola protaetiae]|uniref:GNAT family N-acetyltransferase n=1 Tax=Gryllotalpicola protaetiae TaxID=2419771 RepID=A0A387BK55_9MICO|nr:GNAT family N-acetyltransferase [Gryllotalpicola protaetiae]AYG02672.1 GNAT family N-acetyltransferase [Gryllotalpicola protaetiae]